MNIDEYKKIKQQFDEINNKYEQEQRTCQEQRIYEENMQRSQREVLAMQKCIIVFLCILIVGQIYLLLTDKKTVKEVEEPKSQLAQESVELGSASHFVFLLPFVFH